jgi:hypothetical protein
MKLDLLTNATVVDDAIRFVSEKEHYKESELTTSYSSSKSKDNNKASQGPNHNEEDSDIQEEEVGEIRSITNQVF